MKYDEYYDYIERSFDGEEVSWLLYTVCCSSILSLVQIVFFFCNSFVLYSLSYIGIKNKKIKK